MAISARSVSAEPESGHVGVIPVRNLWLLMLYASELHRHLGRQSISIEQNPDDIPDLIAEILADLVERRLRRNLSLAYRPREAELRKVRGRILALESARRQSMRRGRIACRFDVLTVDTTRNRFIRSALAIISGLVKRAELAHRCRALAKSFGELGVAAQRPTRLEMSADRFGRNDEADRLVVSVAKLAVDIALPTEAHGSVPFVRPDRDVVWLRNLYERALAGFYRVTLEPSGWQTASGKWYNWQIGRRTDRIGAILPSMKTDIVLESPRDDRRIIVDAKFTAVITAGYFRDETIKSGHLFQMYSYLRSQEAENDPFANNATGIFIHPAIGASIDESVEIQGHVIRFATVDLAADAMSIRSRLLEIVQSDPFDRR